MKKLQPIRLLLTAGALASTFGFALGATAGASTARAVFASPHYGGSITLGGSPPTVLDYTQTGYILGNSAMSNMIFGNLFLNPTKPGGPLVPDLALSYSFNKTATQFTVNLRHGVKFSDGTAFNAAAVVWNWKRDEGATAITNQYETSVTSIKAVGPYKVVVNFSEPDSVWISDIASEPLGFMASPAAAQREGQSTFNLLPVGAGPFKVTSDTPGQQIVLKKNSLYWDASHTYLSSITYTNTGTDATANYLDLQSDAIQALGLTGTSSSPTILSQAINNHNFASVASPNDNLLVIPINTTAAPFNNQLAREALDYCTDRSALSSYTAAGFANPAYIFGGPAEFFTPSGGINGASKLQAYPYSVAKGSALVQQIGGLKFQLTTFAGQQVTYATALQAQWAQCGINASINVVSPQVINPDLTNGTYQAIITFSGGQFDPRLVTTFINPTASLDLHGFNDPVVTKALTASFATTKTAKLTNDWTTIWKTMNKDAVLLPILTAPGYTFYNKCLKNLQFNFGTQFTHTWLACTP